MNDTTSFVRKGGADLSYLGTNISLYSRGYYSVKEDPSEGEANFTRIMDLTKFISDASNTTTDNSVVDDWERKMDVDSFLRGMAMEILLSNCDGYFTLANNYLLYDDLENERLIFSGSDFDLTMGLVFAPTVISGNYSEYPGFSERPLSKMMNVPRFKNEFENLLLNITKGLVNNETLMPRIDQAYKMLTTDVEWDRSLPKKGRLALDSLLPGAGNQTSNMNMTNSTQPSNLTESDIEEFFRNGIPFEAAIYGPLPFNVSILLSLKEWITLRSDNILKFFNQTA
jgi:hypothetical protein